MYQSIATIDSPEFIKLEPLDINPLMSKCQIKVLYLGENRNHSVISKEVATEMAKTLRGAPIVGAYSENRNDMTDHGERITVDEDGVHFNCATQAYGFVAPDAEVWFQKFEDDDPLSPTGKTIHEYLMTTGYLWAEQFKKELQKTITEGSGQSMELQEETLQGRWVEKLSNNVEFFIIDDAVFSKLCLLGDAVEPCFEGASVTSFSLEDGNFKNTLYSMMKDLQQVYSYKEGAPVAEETNVITEPVVEEPVVGNESSEPAPVIEDNTVTEPVVEEPAEPTEPVVEEFIESATPAVEEPVAPVEPTEPAALTAEPVDEYSELKEKFELLTNEYNELFANYSALNEEIIELREFKASIEDAKKDEMIASFYMLSDEDKREVIENKAKYSLAEIEAKLAIICVHKKVNFTKENDNEQTAKPVVTYNLNQTEDTAPAWLNVLRSVRNKNS